VKREERLMADHTGIQYRDLDLKIYEDTYGNCWVEAIGTPVTRSDPVHLALDDAQISKGVDVFRQGSGGAEILESLGQTLFGKVFSGAIAALWDRVNVTLDKQTALRVRLDIRNASLSNLPWELMASTRGRPFPLALTPKCPITRCVYASDLPTKAELPQPLRILIIVSSPVDEPEFAAEPILATINTALASHMEAGSVLLETVHHVSMAKLEEKLDSGYDILHYIGHGQFDHDEGCLLLEGPARRASPVNGREFGALLVDANVRLLVITACDLASASRRDPRLGVADAALRAGVPAVIAMQSMITDTEAAWFSSAFYPALIGGEPLESCVWRARRRIYVEESGRRRASWATPVLYSNLPDGLLFDRMPDGAAYQHPNSGVAPDSLRALRPVVVQLPAPWYGELRHRENELNELQRIIEASADEVPKSPIVVSGPPGSGTSSVALETALRCLDVSQREPTSQRAFAGVIWASKRHPPLSGPLPIRPTMGWGIESLSQQLAESLPMPGLRQARPYEQSDLIRAALRQYRYLVIIDDFDELRGLDLEQLTDRLPAPTTVLLTSHLPVGGAAHEVELHQLSADQGADLLQRAAASLLQQAATPSVPAGEILASLGALGSMSGNPLALRLLAGRLADGEDVTATATARARTMEIPSTDQGWLRLLIRESLNRCSAEHMAALRTFALYPEPLTPIEVAHVLDTSEEQVAGFLGHLQRLGLINESSGKTISLSQRVRHETLASVDQEQAENLIRYAIRDTLATIEQNTSRPESDRLLRQIRNAVWTALQAYALRDWRSVLRYRDALHESLFRLELWADGIELGERAYDAADRLGDDETQAWCALYPIARHHIYQKDYQTARLWSERALDKFAVLYRHAKDTDDVAAIRRYAHGVATAKRQLGRVMREMGFLDEAQRLLEDGLSLADEGIGNDMKGHLITGLAELAEHRGDYKTAQRRYRDAFKIYESIPDRAGMGTVELQLGRVALALGHRDEAREHLLRSLRMLQLYDWPRRLAEVLESMADLEESLADVQRDDAQKLYQNRRARAYLLEAQKTVEALGMHADLAAIDVKLTRIAAKLPASDGGIPLGTGFGSADGLRLIGDTSVILIIPLRCPLEGCDRRRTAYDRLTAYWPICDLHQVRMVEAPAVPAVGSE
jgi:tetratricopeptide (TPR) repeat protein